MIKSFLRKLFIGAAPLLALNPANAQESTALNVAVEAADAAKTPDIDTLKPVPIPKEPSIHADPALWLLQDADTKIYLFGSVHILKPGLDWFDEGVKEAFDKSDTLVLELVEPDAAQTQKIFGDYAIDKTGVALRAKLNDTQRASYDAAMTNLGYPVQSFDALKPWAAAVTIQVLALTKNKFDPNSGVEKQLTAAANASNKPIKGVETLQGQLKIFDKLSLASQIDFLTETVGDIDNISGTMDKLINLWAKPDPEALGSLMNEGLTDPALYSALLTNRNAAWAAWLKERLKKPGTVFMAVGAGHLSGATSVQNLLAAYGLKAERVKY